MKIRLGDMRWPEVEEVLKKTNVVILPTGATEQHGRHLPVNFDAAVATHIAEQVARRVTEEHEIRVLVAPTIPYGETFGTPPFGKLLPGTIGISGDTTIRLVEEVVLSLLSQGFKNVLVLNGHLENTTPITAALRRASIQFPNAGLYATNWWYLASDVWASICKVGKQVRGTGAREKRQPLWLLSRRMFSSMLLSRDFEPLLYRKNT